MAHCKYLEEGSALPWSAQSWKINGDVNWVTYSQEEVCHQKSRRLTVFPDRFYPQERSQMCRVSFCVSTFVDIVVFDFCSFSTTFDYGYDNLS